MTRQYDAHTPLRVLNDIRTLSPEELTSFYGIDVAADGTVHDPMENRKFKDLKAWATYIVEQDDENNYSSLNKIGGKHTVDDED